MKSWFSTLPSTLILGNTRTWTNNEPEHYFKAVACRGSWMPGANEVLGCPGQGKSLNFLLSSRKSVFFLKISRFLKKKFHSSPKISYNLFLVIYTNFIILPTVFRVLP